MATFLPLVTRSTFLKEGRGYVSITSERLLVGQSLLLVLLTTAHQAIQTRLAWPFCTLTRRLHLVSIVGAVSRFGCFFVLSVCVQCNNTVTQHSLLVTPPVRYNVSHKKYCCEPCNTAVFCHPHVICTIFWCESSIIGQIKSIMTAILKHKSIA